MQQCRHTSLNYRASKAKVFFSLQHNNDAPTWFVIHFNLIATRGGGFHGCIINQFKIKDERVITHIDFNISEEAATLIILLGLSKITAKRVWEKFKDAYQ